MYLLVQQAVSIRPNISVSLRVLVLLMQSSVSDWYAQIACRYSQRAYDTRNEQDPCSRYTHISAGTNARNVKQIYCGKWSLSGLFLEFYFLFQSSVLYFEISGMSTVCLNDFFCKSPLYMNRIFYFVFSCFAGRPLTFLNNKSGVQAAYDGIHQVRLMVFDANIILVLGE